ncbi:nucleotidyl transferase AbiEii/AbiGii toxin family protein [Marinobacter sp. ELB17]|uniref:nucleotidyl transferase AbiEii/AbiGii toxin family protein n=1 Tax=Marinobacter sp. ELB17 TaxID=270374 RepID=UPI0000F38200|nr:nucleotidyl transferase AbiEii/AbiGii toxin family protein [Marinobacter sp. ELB17]EAZ98133.1 hypothetical protein MELB17_09623 [Marinobacter sp. ELB17]
MQAICEVIKEEGKPLVLKGGTALLLAYNLQRFSEDLDFDLTVPLEGHLNIKSICRDAQKKLVGKGTKVSLLHFKELKKTETTHRCRPTFFVGEDLPSHTIKIEISARTTPDPQCIRVVNGVNVYAVGEIARLKLLAARENELSSHRTAARDLHDLAFIARQWEADLSPDIIAQMEDFFSDPIYLMERYNDAYDDDPIINGRLFDDLSTIEK